MSTETSAIIRHFPPVAECLALVIATLELLPFGILGLRNPEAFADGFGLPISNESASSEGAISAVTHSDTTPTEQKTKKALVAAIAARNIQNGLLIFTFGLVLRDRKSLGVAVLAGLVATCADSIIVRSYGMRERITGHYFGIFNSLTIGGSLLYWGRNDPLW
jgi:hypothetical protein